MKNINKNLQKAMEANILPKYNYFDKGHGIEHVNDVINRSLILAEEYKLNMNMCYTIACYHDIGLEVDRENHHIYSAIAVRNDYDYLVEWFTDDEIEIIAVACEQHRASRKEKPSTIYGCVISDADRGDGIEKMITRSYFYHLEHDENKNPDSIMYNVYNALYIRSGKNGYVKYYLEKSQEFRKDIIEVMENRELFDEKYHLILEKLNDKSKEMFNMNVNNIVKISCTGSYVGDEKFDNSCKKFNVKVTDFTNDERFDDEGMEIELSKNELNNFILEAGVFLPGAIIKFPNYDIFMTEYIKKNALLK